MLLTNAGGNADRLCAALRAGGWAVTCRRKLRLGPHMEAVLFLATVGSAVPGGPAADAAADGWRLPWEDDSGRRTWCSAKAGMREPLRPITGRRPPRAAEAADGGNGA